MIEGHFDFRALALDGSFEYLMIDIGIACVNCFSIGHGENTRRGAANLVAVFGGDFDFTILCSCYQWNIGLCGNTFFNSE